MKSRPRDQLDRGEELRLEQRVHDHHEPRVLAQALLHDGLDRRALQPEDLRRPARARPGGRRPRGAGRRPTRRPGRSPAPASPAGVEAGGIIALTTSPSTALAVCGPPAPGPDIVISVIARDSIVTALNGPADARQRVAAVQERRVHADGEAAVDALGRADQLQPQAELARVLHVVGGDVLDALVARPGRGAPACRTPAARGSPSSPRRRGR